MSFVDADGARTIAELTERNVTTVGGSPFVNAILRSPAAQHGDHAGDDDVSEATGRRQPSLVANGGSCLSHRFFTILQHMKQLLVEVEDDIAADLERVAPARSRRRSEFIRLAIRKALWEEEERATAKAYQRQPDSVDDAYLDATVWEPKRAKRSRRT